jgi:hypothetical protein
MKRGKFIGFFDKNRLCFLSPGMAAHKLPIRPFLNAESRRKLRIEVSVCKCDGMFYIRELRWTRNVTVASSNHEVEQRVYPKAS